MPPREWRVRVEDILGSITKIERYTAGMTFDTFQGDDRTVDAVIRNFQIIGEAARHVPPEVESRFPHVPWIEMRGMRNIVVHEYFGVDLPIVWKTVVDRLPQLATQLRGVLEAQG